MHRISVRGSNGVSGFSLRRQLSSAMLSRGASACMNGRMLRNCLDSCNVAVPVRFLNLHEYQSKELMASYGVRVQRGKVAHSAEEALEAAKELKASNAKDLILKAQILAGGRGKGHFDTGFKGGVKICSEPEEVFENAKKMLGNKLITIQTGPEGQPVEKVLVHEGVDFSKELYLAILMDRAFGGPVIVASPMGGMDIEEVAHNHPEQIHTVTHFFRISVVKNFC